MSIGKHRRAMVALLLMGSAILLFSCKEKRGSDEGSLDAIMTEQSENLTIVMSENGRKSYLFKTPLLEGYTLGRDPYREFRKGISITTYQDDSMTSVNAVLVANYAIFYENRKLWEAKGDVVVTKHDGTRLYTQQLFWNSITKRIYSNVDTKLVTDTDELIGEGFESDEDMNEPRFRRWKGKMQVDTDELKSQQSDDTESEESNREEKNNGEQSAKPAKQTQPAKRADTAESESRREAVTSPAKSSTSGTTARRPHEVGGTRVSPKEVAPSGRAMKSIRSVGEPKRQLVQEAVVVEHFDER